MAQSFIRRFTKKILLFATVILCILFLATCLTPKLNPQQWWIAGFFGLSVPYIFILIFFSVFFWLIAKPILALIPLTTLGIGWKQISVLCALNVPSSFVPVHSDTTIRLVSWNVGNMYGLSKDNDKRTHDRTEIAGAIIKTNADIVCLQEFNHSYTQGPQADNIGLFKSYYAHNYFSINYEKGNGFYAAGTILFSKYPIVKTGKITYPGMYPESLLFADIKIQNDTIRVYTTHLQSFAFNSKDYAEIEKIKETNSQSVQASKNIFSKMKTAFTTRAAQADKVKSEIDKSLYPSVICGDFNDVPNSYIYNHIRGNRQDAFLAKGLGIGKSYIALAPTLRIDYILPDNNFSINQFTMIDESLSDHLMLLSDLSLKK